jgi:thioredoxin-dependent peroxiredoxin
MISEGNKAPQFCLDGIDEKGAEKNYCLKDLLKSGRPLVLYFYPKDNTSGCTAEACDFRDNMNRITAKAQVVGVSPDSLKSHKGFAEKQSLNFPLLSDPDKKVLTAYGAYGEKKMYGKTVMGVIRSTFIIAPDGKVLKAWRAVKVKGHVDEVIEAL